MTKGKVFVSASRGIVLIAGNLPPAPAGKAYEMWTLESGKAKAAGMFARGADGSALHIRGGSARGVEAVEATLEDEMGADQPTTAPVFVAAIRGLAP